MRSVRSTRPAAVCRGQRSRDLVAAGCLALLALAASAASPSPPKPRARGAKPGSPTPTFAVGVQNVNLDVQVTRGGRAVAGLTAADFVVKDNGVRQEVEIVAHEDAAVDAILALDASSSVSGARLSELQRAADAFVAALWPADSVTLLGFATGLRFEARPGTSRAAVHAAVTEIQGRGSTSLYDAVYAALLLTDPPRGRPLVLVFSDGRDHGSWLQADTVRTVTRSSDAVIDAVVVGDEDRTFLDQVTRDTGGRTWVARSDRGLEQAFLAALEDFRSRYRLRYEPRGVRPGGWHALSVKLTGKKGAVLARRGYQGEARE
jgi:VWFA-related protein